MAKLLFWTFIALDTAALGVVFLLGLAAAQPSHTSPLAVVGFFALPALLLLGLVALFLRAPWPAARTAAVVVAAAPVLLVLGGALVSGGVARLMGVDTDLQVRHDPALQQRLLAAIAADDASAAERIATGARAQVDDAAALVAALRQMEKSPPGRPDVLQALLRAGVRPLVGGNGDSPLEVAIAASPRIGAGPVQLLLAAGADVNFGRALGPAWFAAVGKGIDPEVLRLLLDHGADLAARDMAGGPAMKWAAVHGNWGAALLLAERGAAWRDVRVDQHRSVQQVVDERLRAQPGDVQLARLARLMRGTPSS